MSQNMWRPWPHKASIVERTHSRGCPDKPIKASEDQIMKSLECHPLECRFYFGGKRETWKILNRRIPWSPSYFGDRADWEGWVDLMRTKQEKGKLVSSLFEEPGLEIGEYNICGEKTMMSAVRDKLASRQSGRSWLDESGVHQEGETWSWRCMLRI